MRNESIRSCASRVRLVDEPWNGLAPSYAFVMSLTGEEYSFEGLNVWNNLPLPFLRAQTEAEGCPRSVQQSQREQKKCRVIRYWSEDTPATSGPAMHQFFPKRQATKGQKGLFLPLIPNST